MKNREKLLRTTTAALMTALTCVLTLAVRIPSPSKGYINLGDCAVLICGWLLGPVYGMLAGGTGSALADLLAGYPAYIPGTFVIKAVMAFTVSLARIMAGRSEKTFRGADFAVSSVIAETVMIAGYWAYEAAVIGEGAAAALAGVPGNIFQGVAGVAGALVLTGIIKRTGLIEKIPAGQSRRGIKK